MRMFKKYVFVLGLVLVGTNLQTAQQAKFTMPVSIKSYLNMLAEIIKEQKEIIKQVKEGEEQIALDIAGFGLKVGQSNYWLRQQVKQRLKSIRKNFPKLVPLLNKFFGLLDDFYDAEAAVLGAKQYLNQDDLDDFMTVWERLRQDKTIEKLREMIKNKSKFGFISKTFMNNLVEAHKEALTVGKELYNRLEKKLKTLQKKQKKEEPQETAVPAQ